VSERTTRTENTSTLADTVSVLYAAPLKLPAPRGPNVTLSHVAKPGLNVSMSGGELSGHASGVNLTTLTVGHVYVPGTTSREAPDTVMVNGRLAGAAFVSTASQHMIAR
jgi:hypothetical protein